jgi:hypothetical protein
MSVSEPELALNISFPVLENENAGFINFDGEFLEPVETESVVNIGLLARAYATVNFLYEPILQHFDQNDPCSGVQHLLHSCPVLFVLYTDFRAVITLCAVLHLVLRYVR